MEKSHSAESRTIFYFDYWHYYAFLMLLVLLSIHFWYIGILLIYFLYHLRKTVNYLIVVPVILIYLICFGYYMAKETEIDQEVLVVDKIRFDNYDQYTVLAGIKQYQFTSRGNYEIGDIIYLKGEIEQYRKQTVPGGFDSYRYHLGNHVLGRVIVSKVNFVKSIDFFKIRSVDNPFFLLLKDVNLIEIEDIGFLFSLSSIHLAMLIFLLFKLFYYLDIKNKEKHLYATLILSVCYFIGLSVLLLRLFLIQLLHYLNHHFNLSLSRLDMESLTFIFMLLIFPLYIYNQTFILMYLIIFFNQLKVVNNKFAEVILVPMILTPFLMIWQNHLNVFMLFLVPIFSSALKHIFVPVVLLTTMIPFLNFIDYIAVFFERMTHFVNQYSFKLYFPKTEGMLLVLYFGLIIYIFSSSNLRSFMKRIMIYICFIIIGIIYTFKPIEDRVIFLDVGQGDSAVIFKNNQVIVVDAFQGVSKYLEHMYVKSIDYLILTHSDIDHMKEATDLLYHFEVRHLVLSDYQDYGVINQKVIRIGEHNLPMIEDIRIHFLSPAKNYHDDNDNSIVFMIEVNQMHYLFTGDIGISVENDLINTYGHALKSDILKVPHHGSSTSSSFEFLNVVSPSIAVISVGHRNIYRLPNDEVVKRYHLLGIKTHVTSQSGSLLIEGNKHVVFPP